MGKRLFLECANRVSACINAVEALQKCVIRLSCRKLMVSFLRNSKLLFSLGLQTSHSSGVGKCANFSGFALQISPGGTKCL